MVLKTNGKWNGNGCQKTFQKWLNAHLDELYHLADLHCAEDIRYKLQSIVPEYKVQHGSCVLDMTDRAPSNIKIIRSIQNNQNLEYLRNSEKAAFSTI
jgi:hypothetical protein